MADHGRDIPPSSGGSDRSDPGRPDGYARPGGNQRGSGNGDRRFAGDGGAGDREGGGAGDGERGGAGDGGALRAGDRGARGAGDRGADTGAPAASRERGNRAGGGDGAEAARVDKPSTAHRILKGTAVTLTAAIGLIVVVLLLLIVALQTNWGGTRFADFLLAIANPFDEARTEYEELRGNFLTRVELRGLHMFQLDTVYVDTSQAGAILRRARKDTMASHLAPAAYDTFYVDTLSMAAIDTFRIRYNLLALLGRRVDFREIYFANPVLTARQRADSTWDLLDPFRDPDTLTTEPLFTFDIGEARVTDGALHAQYYAPGRDSILQITDFNLQAGEFRIAEALSGRIDTLHTRYNPPGFDYWTYLRGGGRLDENELDLSLVELESPFSLVSASGRLTLPSEEEEEIQDIDFRLQADPLTFRDIRLFVPALHPDRSATIDASVTGSTRFMNVDVAGVLSDGATLTLQGDVSLQQDGPLAYRLDVAWQRINPAFFTTPPADEPTTLLTGSAEVDLAGSRADALNGSFGARLDPSTVGGYRLEQAALSGEMRDGQADLDLRAVWNGSVVTADGFVRPFDDIPSYDLSGRTREFNMASFTGPDQQSAINADFRVNGYGIDPETAEIQAVLTVGPSTVNKYRIDDGRVNLDLQMGELRYGVRFLFPDGLLVANGDAGLDDPITYRVQRGRFENLDLASLLGDDRTSSLSGSFQAHGTGLDPSTLTAEANLEMEPSSYGDFRLETGSADIILSGGRLEANVLADLSDAGAFDFAAVTRPLDDVPTLRVTRGEFRNVDVNAFLEDSDHESDLSGTATFTMTRFDPEVMMLDGTFALSQSRFNDQEINSAQIAVEMSRGVIAFDAGMDLPDGDLQLAGSAQPFHAVPFYQVQEGRFRNINLAAFTGNPNLTSSLNGTLALSGSGFDPATLEAEGRIAFRESRLNEQDITSASVAGTLSEGELDAELQLVVPEGRSTVVATARLFDEVPTYVIHEGTFQGVNVAALTGDPRWQTSLSGTIQLAGEGFEPEEMSTAGSIQIDPSVINRTTITGGVITGSVEDGFVEFETDLTFDDGSANVQGTGALFAEIPSYQVGGTLRNVNVADLIGNDTLSARLSADFAVDGSGTDPRTMSLQGQISSDFATYEGADVDALSARFALESGVLQVESLDLRSTAADARGSGVIALFDTTAASDFSFVADLKDPAPIRNLVAAENLALGSGRLEGRVYGRTSTLQFDATGQLSNLVYDDIRLATFDGTLAGELGPDRTLTIAELDGRLGALSLPGFLIEDADLEVEYLQDRIVFQGNISIDAERTAEIAGVADMREDVQRITLEAMTLDLAGRHWELLQEASITYGDEYRISNFLLYSDNQQIAIDGIVDPDGEQNLVMTIEDFEMQTVADLIGYEGLGGILNGSLLLSGPGEAPNISGALFADLTSSGEAVGDLQLELDYEDLRLNLDARLSHEDGSTLTALGYVPLDLRLQRLEDGGLSAELADRSVDLTITADSFSVGWIDPFLDPETINEFDGRLHGGVDVSGTLDNPVLDGTAAYIAGRIGLVDLGLAYRDIHANLDFRQNQVEVSNLRIRSGPGSLTGEGTINLAQLTLGEFDIDLRANDFLAIDSREYEAVVDGEMHLTGTTRRPVLDGSLQVESAEIVLTEQTTAPELERVELTEQDLLTLEQRFGLRITEADTTTFDFYEALAMNLSVQIDRNTWLRSRVNPVMDIQFSGRLDLMKDHYSDVRVFGTIDVVEQRSRIVQFGKRFNITTGTLTFNGPPEDPFVDIGAEYDVRTLRGSTEDVTITLTLNGQLSEQLDLTLGSDPTMAYADIVSYIATGQPASASLQLGGLGGTGADLAVGQLTTLVEGIAGQRLGLDVVTIDQSGGAPTVTAGKYVTSRLFVSVSQLIGDANNVARSPVLYDENTPLITVEYEVQNWLLLRLLQSGAFLRMNVLVEYAY